MPTIRMHELTQPAEIAAGLASTIAMLDRLRPVIADDRDLLAEVDRNIVCAAAMLNGAIYLNTRHVSPRVAEIMAMVADANGQQRRASA